jgi:penicillin-binding protein 2
MFHRRLHVLLLVAVLAATALVARLYHLQILQGDDFRRLAEAALQSPPEPLQPVRGRILDRYGRTLVSDEPCYDVAIAYGALRMDPLFLSRLEQRTLMEPAVRMLPPDERSSAAHRIVRERIAAMWITLARAAEMSPSDLQRRRDDISRRVEALRNYLWNIRAARGYEESLENLRLAEDEMFHPILRDVTLDVRARIELDLSDVPWLRIQPSVRRTNDAAPSMCHLIGRIGQVSPEHMTDDPFRDEPLRRYLPGEQVGVSGVERLGEFALRGVRGVRQRDRDGHTLLYVDPQDGRDIRLTIDQDLQERITNILAEAVAGRPHATGASCVVIDVSTRQVLALVSFPIFDPRRFDTHYRQWRDDSRTRPLLFRAVSAEYPPGSVLKPLALLAGLAAGVVDPGQTIECRGRLLPDIDAWRCWTTWRNLSPHGPVAAVEALQHSCNIYFYTVGQRVGAERLTRFYRQVLQEGGGSDNPLRWSVGFIEERPGHVPDADWMTARRGRGFTIGDARNFALGQGEIQLSPLQVANLFATIADGAVRAPSILLDDPNSRPRMTIPFVTPHHWTIIRDGLYRCVNEYGGTAYHGARMDDLAVCGKTGSAQCVPRVIRRRYVFQTADAQTVSVAAPTLEAAREALGLPASAKPISNTIVERWPNLPESELRRLSHAWFAGYAPRHQPRVALSLIIEFGGSGGQEAAPVAREVFRALMESPEGYLSPARAKPQASLPGAFSAF